MSGMRMARARRSISTLAAFVVMSFLLVGCAANGQQDPSDTVARPSANPAMASAVQRTVEERFDEWGLGAVIVRVTEGGDDVLTQAWGESLPGVPATTEMHFRNGAVAISYVATLLLLLVEDGTVSLDDPISYWLPEVPHSEQVTLGQLAQMTSGYADYLWDAAFLELLEEDPFRTWTPEELHPWGTDRPLVYEPGTNWNYSHTDYVLLGLAIERITGRTVDDLLQERVLDPLDLANTQAPGTPAIQDPVLHAYTSERRAGLGIPSEHPFIEESTYWDPSWTITRGAVQNTNIYDLERTARAIGTGELLSPESFAIQTDPWLRGVASQVDGCPACFPQSEIYTYGIGVVMMGDWILQNPMFSGTAAITAYLPAEQLAVSIVVTYRESAFDADGAVTNRAQDYFYEIVKAIAPEYVPPTR